MRQILVAIFIVLSMMLMPWQGEYFVDEETSKSYSSAIGEDLDAWRIGDRWVYETLFDVQQLIANSGTDASLNTLTGDTQVEVTDIADLNYNGTQTLVYIVEVSGSFTSGSNGATLQGATGSLDVQYTGTDIIRARDLAVIQTSFRLEVDFNPNIGLICWVTNCELADITITTEYQPGKEKRDFPIRSGDFWYQNHWSDTTVDGESDYFDVSTFGSSEEANSSWQVVDTGTPLEDGTSIQYAGCGNSYKITEVNITGQNQGMEWFCPAVRSYAWSRVVNEAGFQIDWLLKEYYPAASNNVAASSDPGVRQESIEVSLEFIAAPLDYEQDATATYQSSTGTGVPGSNLYMRYETAGSTSTQVTDNAGVATFAVDTSSETDDTPSTSDYASRGLIIWDPVTKIIGVATIVMQVEIVGLDLVAQMSSAFMERTRDGQTQTFTSAQGYNVIPGDSVSLSIPVQNNGIADSPAFDVTITYPDASVIQERIPTVEALGEERIIVEWSIPVDMAISQQNFVVNVDSSNEATQDADLTNNQGTISLNVGRLPEPAVQQTDGVYTFEPIFYDATGSIDPDGGDVTCVFSFENASEDSVSGFDTVVSTDCMAEWNWSNDGDWQVQLYVTDDESDEVLHEFTSEVLNRAPEFEINGVDAIYAGDQISFSIDNITDIDTESITPVTFSWTSPFMCDGQVTTNFAGLQCEMEPQEEGVFQISVIGTDDDGATTERNASFEVVNKAPTIEPIEMWVDGVYLEQLDGMWHLDEYQTVTLKVQGSDTLFDLDSLQVSWSLSEENETSYSTDTPTLSTLGGESEIEASWHTSGQHQITAKVIDDNGATSEIVYGTVNISNIAPDITLTNVPGLPIGEDEIVTISFEADDGDVLMYCWDLDATFDSNEDGVFDNDCDKEGAQFDFIRSLSTPLGQPLVITANVWDDDMARDNQSFDIIIVNQPPRAIITDAQLGLTVTQNELFSISAANSIDTESDRPGLRFTWDNPSIPGTEDGMGEEYQLSFDRPGTYTVILTVSDDDGEVDTDEIKITVTEIIEQGIFGTSGTTEMAAYGLIGFIVILLGILLFSRRGSSDEEILGLGSGFGESTFSSGPPPASPVQGQTAPSYMGQTAQQPIYPQQNAYQNPYPAQYQQTQPQAQQYQQSQVPSPSYAPTQMGYQQAGAMTTPQTSYQPQATQTAWPSATPQAVTPSAQTPYPPQPADSGLSLSQLPGGTPTTPQITNQSPVASNDLNDLLDGLDL